MAILRLYNFIYPANVEQAKSINSTLLAEDAQGRVDITRTFDGRELNTEYLFGLFANLAANPDLLTILGVPVSYEVTHFSANQHIAAAQTRFIFNFTSLGLVLPVIIESWNTWNAKGEITQYNASFKYWQWMVDTVIGASMPLLNATTPAEAVQILTSKVAASICNTAQTFCNGENTQYDSMASCYQYLTQETRFGASYEVGRDTLLCRIVHQNMVPFRPSVHCNHIGPTGGGYCTDDTTYVSTVMNKYFKI
ncbi:hypothetical protein LSUE1_G005917, partial [Lachnellula suecica]